MKIFIPNLKNDVGGGWTFLRNFTKGMQRFVEFVTNVQECDVVFIPGVTMVDRDQIEQAEALGKKIVFRMDNIPRKSRNKRSRVYDNIKRYAELADVVVYQSEWAKNYCYPMTGEGTVIYNGVDEEIFNTDDLAADRDNRYLFLYHGKSELKQFWVAHYIFQMEARKNKNAEFWFVYNFKNELPELLEANFDFWNGEKFHYVEPTGDPFQVAALMKQCGTLIFPSVADAAPNTVLEARACGMKILGVPEPFLAGTQELVDMPDISLDRMSREYNALFELVTGDKDIET